MVGPFGELFSGEHRARVLARVAPPDLPTPSQLGRSPRAGAGLPATGGGWTEGRTLHLGRLLVVRRCALIDAGQIVSIGSPSGDEVGDGHRDAHLVGAPRGRRGHDPDDDRRNGGGTGPQVAAETGEIDQAIRLAQNTEFDLAILDVNVQGKLISPVAELITALNRPIIFATGYGAAGIPTEFRGRPSLEKPFLIEKLARTIDPEKPSLRK